jgi:cellulose synthase/poly-beta-1,6-N-acetylglucosamine synthase-like glycosyltransferase
MSRVSVYALAMLWLVWAGYPIVIACLAAQRRRRGQPAAPRGESVSVILAPCEDAVAIRSRVFDLLRTSFAADRLEVIVALDAARAKATAAELADLDARVVVIAGDAPGGKAATLNAAVRMARNDVLVFADTAQRFRRCAISELVDALADQRLGAVSGMLDARGRGRGLSLSERYWRYERWLRNREARLYSGVGVTGAIYAMRRRLWEPLPAGLILDDVYVPMRLVLGGWRIGFTDRARATDTRGFAVKAEYRRKVRTLTGVVQVCAWLPRVLNPFRNPVWVQFTCHKLLRLLTPYLVLAAAGDVAWHAALAIGSGAGNTNVLLFAALGAALASLVPRLRRRIAAPIVWGLALQSSIVMATVNGLRGRWDVWQQ